MIPIGDDNSSIRYVPVVTYLLIALNGVVFLLELSGGESFIMEWAYIPSRFLAAPLSNLPTLLTAMFMHGGWAHLIGNMLYLWIFGDNVEDALGRLKYLPFYLLSGLAATGAQTLFNPASTVPNVGASGAIAGVLGAYILLWPKSHIKVLLGRSMTEMPALLVIGFWFVLQFFSSLSGWSSTEDTGGVAYMAHIGGFLAGLLMAFLFKSTMRR